MEWTATAPMLRAHDGQRWSFPIVSCNSSALGCFTSEQRPWNLFPQFAHRCWLASTGSCGYKQKRQHFPMALINYQGKKTKCIRYQATTINNKKATINSSTKNYYEPENNSVEAIERWTNEWSKWEGNNGEDTYRGSIRYAKKILVINERVLLTGSCYPVLLTLTSTTSSTS